MGKCHFRSDWLERKDVNGFIVKEWAQKQDEHHGFCMLCRKSFNVSCGFDAVQQHAAGKNHKTACSDSLSKSQLRLSAARATFVAEEPVNAGTSAGTVTVQLYSVREKTSIAELRWVMKCIASNYSASSCEGIGELFSAMFGEECVGNFSLSRTKVRYLISDALGPYFKQSLMEDMKGARWSLSFDETTNSAHAKELQTGVTYWSNSSGMVESHHLETFFIGSATADELIIKLNEAIDNSGLPRSHLLMLGRDGPKVNDKVERLLSDQLMELRDKPLVKIGSCNVHILHNAFQKGLLEFGSDASDLVFKIHHFFENWPLRREEFRTIQEQVCVPIHNFIKHVDSRWLTLQDATERLLEQWPAVLKYFLHHIPEKRKNLKDSRAYRDIVSAIKQEDMKAQLLFIRSSAAAFARFTGAFQSREPMIHLLFDELERLARVLIGKISNPSSVKKLGVCEEVLDSQHLIPVMKLQVDDNIMAEMSKLKERSQLVFLHHCQKHVVAACRHVLLKSALRSPIVKLCRCLQPALRKSARSVSDITELAKNLSVDVDAEVLRDEWRMLQGEEETLTDGRIDVYWNQFFKLKTVVGTVKYPSIALVVKSALSLTHGNAEIERGFSTSAKFLTEEKACMSVRTLSAAMTVKSAMKKYLNKPQLVPVTKNLLNMAQHACANYKAYLEEQQKLKEKRFFEEKEEATKKAAEEEKRKALVLEKEKLKKEENKLQELKKNEETKRKIEEQLLAEANKKLKSGIEKQDMLEINVAKAMLDSVSKLRKEGDSHKKEVEFTQKSIDKKKNKMITDFFQKPK